MACPVCDHTMQNLGVEGRRVFWCPRCGTLKMEHSDHVDLESPTWIRQIKLASRFDGPRENVAQHTMVKCVFEANQHDLEPTQLQLREAHK